MSYIFSHVQSIDARHGQGNSIDRGGPETVEDQEQRNARNRKTSRIEDSGTERHRGQRDFRHFPSTDHSRL